MRHTGSRARIRTAAPGSADFLAAVEERLQQALEEQRRAAGSVQFGEMWQQIARAVHGGKRTRPLLVSLGHRAFAGGAGVGDAQRVVELGCAFEFLHTALLAHDDVIDEDFVRRGRPTLSAHYRDAASHRGQPADSAAQVGRAAAIIAGDVLIAQAIRLACAAVAGSPAGPAVMDAFYQAILQSAAGELDDVLFSAGVAAAELDDVLRMHRLKTSAYSFESPLRTGALLAEAPAGAADQLAEVGRWVGISYQIIDDVLGTFGDPAMTGKSNESDLHEGKRTVLIAIAERLPEAAEALHEWRAGTLCPTALRGVLGRLGIEEQARSLAQQYGAAARTRLAVLAIADEIREPFEVFIDEVLTRRA